MLHGDVHVYQCNLRESGTNREKVAYGPINASIKEIRCLIDCIT